MQWSVKQQNTLSVWFGKRSAAAKEETRVWEWGGHPVRPAQVVGVVVGGNEEVVGVEEQ